MSEEIKIGDKVKQSGVGPGEITGFTERVYKFITNNLPGPHEKEDEIMGYASSILDAQLILDNIV
jgi:hypothetical protein